jgi:hypothetical protein
VRALEGAGGSRVSVPDFLPLPEPTAAEDETRPAEQPAGPTLPPNLSPCRAEEFARRLMALAASGPADPALEAVYRLGGVAAPLLPLKLTAFREKWNAVVVAERPDEHVFRVADRPSFWQRCFGRQQGLTVRVRWQTVPRERGADTLLTVRVEPCGAGPADRAQLEERGQDLLASLGGYLQVRAAPRVKERQVFESPVCVYPVGADGEPGPAGEGVCRDVSLNGMAFEADEPPPTPQVWLNLPAAAPLAGYAVRAEVIRADPTESGGYLVGVRFVD